MRRCGAIVRTAGAGYSHCGDWKQAVFTRSRTTPDQACRETSPWPCPTSKGGHSAFVAVPGEDSGYGSLPRERLAPQGGSGWTVRDWPHIGSRSRWASPVGSPPSRARRHWHAASGEGHADQEARPATIVGACASMLRRSGPGEGPVLARPAPGCPGRFRYAEGRADGQRVSSVVRVVGRGKSAFCVLTATIFSGFWGPGRPHEGCAVPTAPRRAGKARRGIGQGQGSVGRGALCSAASPSCGQARRGIGQGRRGVDHVGAGVGQAARHNQHDITTVIGSEPGRDRVKGCEGPKDSHNQGGRAAGRGKEFAATPASVTSGAARSAVSPAPCPSGAPAPQQHYGPALGRFYDQGDPSFFSLYLSV